MTYSYTDDPLTHTCGRLCVQAQWGVVGPAEDCLTEDSLISPVLSVNVESYVGTVLTVRGAPGEGILPPGLCHMTHGGHGVIRHGDVCLFTME
jgi:hypothetical protein